MGVPSFYRWLVNKYPNIVANAIEDKGESLDTSLPNPNGIEFDHFYIDMNGIIHPCFHPEDEDGNTLPSTFEEVFENIFKYIDRLFNIVRPRNLLYMAIDGVAPRAKMNQQRARRFRTAKDKEIAEEEELRVRKQVEMEGKQVLPKQESAVSDSNIITPGTEFMHKLSKALQTYVTSRLSSDLGWRNIEVILSDANVPGEGEHKIMSFIRQQRTLPSYNPNTRHCLYGLDADLIMLALATHEVHFSILREDVLVQEQTRLSHKPVPETSVSTTESPSSHSRQFQNVLNSEENQEKNGSFIIRSKPYQFLHAWILREYLELDMQISDPPENFKFDIERIIDDFIFICFFVGNDFLPHIPSLAIHEGAIDLLMTVYKKELKKLGGYLVDMIRVEAKKEGFIKMSRVERFILLAGASEEKIFKKRSELRERKLRQICLRAVEEEEDYGCELLNGEAIVSKDSAILSLENVPSSENISSDYSELLKNTKELEERVKNNLRRKSDLFRNGGLGTDKVRLGSPGYKERYYREKFSAESPGEIESTRKKLVEKYTEGLVWVLLYYFSGPPSWTWFYPYHYGPFASDFKGLSQVKAKFQKGFPFKPFDQLLSVLPPRSAHALPKAFQNLMNDDSPLIDFFPTDFEIDMDGKRFSWQGVCKLPLIDEARLLSETAKLEKDLGVEESERNTEKLDQLLVRSTHRLGSHILSLSTECNEVRGTSLSEEIGGFIRLGPEYMVMNTKVHTRNQEESVLCVRYEPSDCGSHIPCLLEGVILPEKRIREDDIRDTQLWHESHPHGTKPANRYNTSVQERFSKISISEPTHKDVVDSRWGSAERGKITSENCGSLVSQTNRRASMISWNADETYSNANFISDSYHDQYVHKGTGFGRGSTGKEKSIVSDHNSKAQTYTSRGIHGQGVYTSSNSGSDMGKFHYDLGSSRGTSDPSEEWQTVMRRSRHGSRFGSRELRTPEWDHRLIRPPNGGFQPRNGSFWPSSTNNAWPVDHNSKAQTYTDGRIHSQGVYTSSNSGSEMGKFHYDPRRPSGSHGEWKKVVVGPSRDGSGNGSRELGTPEWNHPVIRPPNGGFQPRNASFCPAGNNAWCQTTSQRDGSSGRGLERRAEDSKDFMAYNWQHSSSNACYSSSNHVKGRGQSFHRG